MNCQQCGGRILRPGLDSHECENCGRTFWSPLNRWEDLPSGHYTEKSQIEGAVPQIRFGNPEQIGELTNDTVIGDFRPNSTQNLMRAPVYRLPCGVLTYDKGQLRATRIKAKR